MPAVVADAGPLHYLVLIGQVDLLPRLFTTVVVPAIVHDELSRARTPSAVRSWTARRPSWLHVTPTPPVDTLPLPELDDGERAAIALALSLRVDLILMDDRDGVAAALAQGLAAIGTLGLLDRAARRGMIDLGASLARLKATNFRYRPQLLDELLARFEADGDGV